MPAYTSKVGVCPPPLALGGSGFSGSVHHSSVQSRGLLISVQLSSVWCYFFCLTSVELSSVSTSYFVSVQFNSVQFIFIFVQVKFSSVRFPEWFISLQLNSVQFPKGFSISSVQLSSVLFFLSQFSSINYGFQFFITVQFSSFHFSSHNLRLSWIL